MSCLVYHDLPVLDDFRHESTRKCVETTRRRKSSRTHPSSQLGLNYYIISPDEDFERIFGRKAAKRRKLYNGMLKCQLFMYY